MHLAGIFDEIARCAAKARIGDIIVEIMQRMTEFVEQRGRIIKTDQRRLAVAARNEVIVIRGKAIAVLAAQLILAAIGRHPGTGAFSLPREIVEIEYPDDLFAALHFERAHLRLEHWYRAGILGEGHAVELVRHFEHRVDHIVELEIRFDLGFIEIIFRLADLLCIEAIVPRLDGNSCAFGIRHFLHVSDFFPNPGNRGWPDLHHQIHRRIRIFRHGVSHTVMGVTFKAQQFGPVRPQFQDFGDRHVGVIRITIVAAVDIGVVNLFAKVAAGRILQEGLHHRTGVLERPTFLFLRFGCGADRGDEAVGQSGQFRFVGQVDIGFFISQHLVRKFVKGFGQFCVEADQLLLFLAFQFRAITDK